ncbi:MAG: hypothetical protein AAF384_19620, partial [Pseudomonadota bacterium]
ALAWIRTGPPADADGPCVWLLALRAAEVCAQTSETPAAFAECAAYYFNATNAKPVQDYETYYAAGEGAYNASIKAVGKAQTQKLVEDTSREIRALMQNDWRKFTAVDEKYEALCAGLLSAQESDQRRGDEE